MIVPLLLCAKLELSLKVQPKPPVEKLKHEDSELAGVVDRIYDFFCSSKLKLTPADVASAHVKFKFNG